MELEPMFHVAKWMSIGPPILGLGAIAWLIVHFREPR
jgi:hypothetical protein